MKRITAVIAAVGLAFSAYGALQDNYGWTVLGLLVALTSVVVLALSASRSQRLSDVYASLSPQERTLLSPIRRMRAEIEKLTTEAQSEAVRMIAKEALDEADSIIAHAVKLVSARSDILKALAAEPSASRESEELRASLDTATADESPTLESALQSRERESAYYAKLRKSLDRIESTLKQAEAALAEMKAKLAVSAAIPAETEDTDNNLREGMDRLRALGVSFDEAEQMFQGRSV